MSVPIPTHAPLVDYPEDDADTSKTVSEEMKELMAEFRESSSPAHLFRFLTHTALFIWRRCPVMVFQLIITLFPALMIVIGWTNLEDCPTDDRLPYWLMFTGLAYIVWNLASLLRRCVAQRTGCGCRFLMAIRWLVSNGAQAFLVVWLVIGTVWILSSIEDVDMRSKISPLHCSPSLFLSCVVVLSLHSLPFLLGSIMCCTLTLSKCNDIQADLRYEHRVAETVRRERELERRLQEKEREKREHMV